MTEKKRPFVGYIVSGEPVTTRKAMEAGIIKQREADEYSPRTEPITQADYIEMVNNYFDSLKPTTKTDNDGNN